MIRHGIYLNIKTSALGQLRSKFYYLLLGNYSFFLTCYFTNQWKWGVHTVTYVNCRKGCNEDDICCRIAAEIFYKRKEFQLLYLLEIKHIFAFWYNKFSLLPTVNPHLYLSCHSPQLFILILRSCQGADTLPRSHPPWKIEARFSS